jgi:hypothetical protein
MMKEMEHSLADWITNIFVDNILGPDAMFHASNFSFHPHSNEEVVILLILLIR